MTTKHGFINLRLDGDTRTILANLADALQVSDSALVRQLIVLGLTEMFKFDYVRQSYEREFPSERLATKYYQEGIKK
jgi:hypothetical protein